MVKKKDDADGNARVCHIEHGPVEARDGKIEEVHHLSEEQPVNDVPHGSSRNEGQGKPEGEFPVAKFPRIPDHHRSCHHRRYRENEGTAVKIDAEGNTRVFHVRQTEETPQDWDGLVRSQVGSGKMFGDLVGENRQNRRDQRMGHLMQCSYSYS